MRISGVRCHLTYYTVTSVRKRGGAMETLLLHIINISTILWISRSYNHSYCLDYCISDNFEQIKNNHSALHGRIVI